MVRLWAWSDGLLKSAYELCTNLTTEELKEINELLDSKSVNPRDLKMRLAYEVTKINHGETKAKAAQDNFINCVQKKELPQDIKSWQASKNIYNIVDLLVEAKLVSSKTDARRLIEQGAIKIKDTDGQSEEIIKDVKQDIKIDGEMILQRGKLQFLKIIK